MKLLFIDFTLPYLLKDSIYPVGGWAVELNSWINGLCSNGHQVGVLTWKGANRFVNKKLNFDLIETYDPDKSIKILRYFYYYIPTLYKKAAQYKPDVIIQACSGLNTGIMAFIADRLNIPFIYRVANDMDTDNRYKNRLLKYEQTAYQYGLKRAKAVLCQNRYQYESLKTKFPAKTLYILHNPFFTSDNIPVIFRKDRKYIAWLGVFQKQKNLPLLCDIAQKMPETEFKIAGMPGKNMDDDTREALTNLEILSNVEFTGYLSRNQVFSFLSKAMALLNTSHYEGFSNTFLEAFSAGTPVIAQRTTDPDNIIAENGLGLSITNHTDFPKLIKSLYDDKNKFDEISKKCREYVYKNHDPKILANRLVQNFYDINK